MLSCGWKNVQYLKSLPSWSLFNIPSQKKQLSTFQSLNHQTSNTLNPSPNWSNSKGSKLINSKGLRPNFLAIKSSWTGHTSLGMKFKNDFVEALPAWDYFCLRNSNLTPTKGQLPMMYLKSSECELRYKIKIYRSDFLCYMSLTWHQ